MKKRRIKFFALGGIALSVVVMAFLLSELTLRQLFPEKEMSSMVIQVDKNGETASSVQFFSYEAEYGALMNVLGDLHIRFHSFYGSFYEIDGETYRITCLDAQGRNRKTFVLNRTWVHVNHMTLQASNQEMIALVKLLSER